MLEFISLNDHGMTGDDEIRKTSLEVTDDSLRVVGNLPHGHRLTLDRREAVKLIHALKTLFVDSEDPDDTVINFNA